MKLKGKPLDQPKPIVIPITRGDDVVIFKAAPVLDQDDFDAIAPRPQPPIRTMAKTGEKIAVENDRDYQKELDTWSRQRTDHMILKSLMATEDLEWETVDWNDPTTFKNYREEFRKAYFTPVQVAQIINAVFEANGLSQDRIDEARRSFLLRPEEHPA
jgi:hypothetical protein